MPVSLPKVLILFSFLIDLKEMPIDEYNRQLLQKSYVLAMLQLIFFQSAFLYFRHLCYFSEIIS
jgi:hypothetical protein